MAWNKPSLITGLAWIVTAVLAAVTALGGFWLGQSTFSKPYSSPSPTVTVTPTPLTSLPPGTYDFDAVLTGTCLETFDDAWQLTYDVVACSRPHAAQVIRAGRVPEFSATYPGQAQVQALVVPLCTELGLIDPATAQANPNVVVTFSYPVTVVQWRESRGSYFCFAANADGSPLTDSLVASLG